MFNSLSSKLSFHHRGRRFKPISTTTIHIMALDGLVNVNSLFTLALFLGLTWSPDIDPSITLIGGNDAACIAGRAIVESLVSCHVYSFSCFLFSSLVALALKQSIVRKEEFIDVFDQGLGGGGGLVSVNVLALRVGMLVSGFGSVIGCGFLMWALVDLVQIKLGTLACGSLYTVAAVAPLVILVPMALAIFLFLVLYAFIR